MHMMAERVQPPEASLQQAQAVYAVYGYDQRANLSDAITQRDLSLVSTWDSLLRHVALDPSMADDDFACIFDDDIFLHDGVTQSVARRAILRGMDLARKDGLLFLGSCGPMCADEPSVWLQTIEYRKCQVPCSHALCVAKRKSGTLMSEVRDAWQANLAEDKYQSVEEGPCMESLLRVYAEHSTSMWTVGANLWSEQWLWYGDQLNGIFCQGKGAHQDKHWTLARSAHERSHGMIGAAASANLSTGLAGLFDWML